MNKLIESQIAAAEKVSNLPKIDNESEDKQESEIKSYNPNTKLMITLNESKKRKRDISYQIGFDDLDDSEKDRNVTSNSNSNVHSSQLDQILVEAENRDQELIRLDDTKNRKDYWLQEGIVVKILNKAVGDGKYFNKKGIVMKVIDNFAAKVKVDAALLQLDQEDLQTVIPKVRGVTSNMN
jgi:hypothetical protein